MSSSSFGCWRGACPISGHERTLEITNVNWRRIEIQLEQRGGWMRLRDKGHRMTMTYKQTTEDRSAIDTTPEAEIQVNDFEATKSLDLVSTRRFLVNAVR